MAKEIERKFLTNGDEWRNNLVWGQPLITITQGYLVAHNKYSTRVRVISHGPIHYRDTGHQFGYIAVKGATVGATRDEFEYPIPVDDAQAIMELCDLRVIKTRYLVRCGATTWEVDEFGGHNKGLTVAEVELPSEGAGFDRPDWLGEEVTYDPKYLNSELAKHPYKDWE